MFKRPFTKQVLLYKLWARPIRVYKTSIINMSSSWEPPIKSHQVSYLQKGFNWRGLAQS